MSALGPFVLEAGLGALLLIVFVAGLLARGEDRRAIAWVATFGVLGLAVVALLTPPAGAGLGGRFVQDGLALFAKRLFLTATFIGLLAGLSAPGRVFARRAMEYHLLVLASLLGMLVLASARDLVLLFLAFELMSIPLYVLSGFLKRDAGAVEAALKFFLVGSVSSAVMAYGLSFVYGATGTTDLLEIAKATTTALHTGNLLLIVGEVFIFAGFGFKVSAVPFHMWAPDIYEGAPTPSTLFFSVGSKAAGFAALLRVFVFSGLVSLNNNYLWVMVAVVAALTMIVGNVGALLQTNIKRMMAYSSIGQAGYLLVGFAALIIHKTSAGSQAMMVFLFVFVVTNIGAFAGIIALGDATGRENIRDFDGFGRRSPWIAAGMAVCFLALAGIPPMAGFLSKLVIFWAAWGQGSGMTILVIIGLLMSAVSIVYYANVVWRMYVIEPEKREYVQTSAGVGLTMAIAVIGIIVLTIVFGPLLAQIGLGANSLFGALVH